MLRILIEGPELSGKSTIAKALADEFTNGAIDKHVVPDDEEAAMDAIVTFVDSAHLLDGICITDRLYYPSDVIYSPIFNNGKESFLSPIRQKLDKLMSIENILVLYVYADEFTIGQRYDIRGDEYLSKEDCIKSASLYREFMQSTTMSVRELDTSDLDIETMIQKAFKIVNTWINEKESTMKINSGNRVKRHNAIVELLESIGENTSREGLLDTPDRVSRMYDEIFAGYEEDPKEHLRKQFSAPNDEIVLVRDIEFWSHCEHHMVPFFGKAHIAYIPKKNGKVVGISKLARVVEGYSKRLQIQERLGNQIANAIEEVLEPQAIAVIIEADHLCMKMRGVKNPCANTVTSVMRGAFRNVPAARQELFALIELRK